MTETVANITLPNCELLPPKELAEVMGSSSAWPHPANQDPWVLVHDSIRHDMKDIQAGVAASLKQVQGGKPMEAWQPANLARFFPMFYTYVHSHHDHEEELFFPWLSTRVVLPPKMSADHATLMAALDKCGELAKSMKATGNMEQDAQQLQAFQAAFDDMAALMLEHFKEEEEIGLPMMRKHFTIKDFKPIEKKIVASMSTQELAHFLNHITLERKKTFMTTVLRIPGLIQMLVILPACRKYSKQWHGLLVELQAGQQVQKQSKGLFSWAKRG